MLSTNTIIAFSVLYLSGYFTHSLWVHHSIWAQRHGYKLRHSCLRFLRSPHLWVQALKCTALSIVALFGVALNKVEPPREEENSESACADKEPALQAAQSRKIDISDSREP